MRRARTFRALPAARKRWPPTASSRARIASRPSRRRPTSVATSAGRRDPSSRELARSMRFLVQDSDDELVSGAAAGGQLSPRRPELPRSHSRSPMHLAAKSTRVWSRRTVRSNEARRPSSRPVARSVIAGRPYPWSRQSLADPVEPGRRAVVVEGTYEGLDVGVCVDRNRLDEIGWSSLTGGGAWSRTGFPSPSR